MKKKQRINPTKNETKPADKPRLRTCSKQEIYNLINAIRESKIQEERIANEKETTP
jgi:hypothetical protein